MTPNAIDLVAMNPPAFRLVRRFAAVHAAIALLSLAAWAQAINAWMDPSIPPVVAASARERTTQYVGEGYLLVTVASEAAICLLWQRSPALAPRVCPRALSWGNALAAASLGYVLWLGPRSRVLSLGLDALAAGVGVIAALCFVASLPAMRAATVEPLERDSLFSIAMWLGRIQATSAWILAGGVMWAEFP